jgi:Asp/Glu/hydantoin racemase
MRILLINPNITAAMTDSMAAEARIAAREGTLITPVTATFGTQYIANRAEAAIAAHAVLEAMATHSPGHDAAIVSAFGDPGLNAARELFDIPVVGLPESAMLMAWPLGRRYSIVCLTPRLRQWYQECAREHGLDGRLASVRALDANIPDILTARDQFRSELIAQCRVAVAEDGAEVIIIGGGPLAGLAREAADDIPVPVLDGVTCAVRLAETLIATRPRKPLMGSLSRPPAKPSLGLAGALATRMSGAETSD